MGRPRQAAGTRFLLLRGGIDHKDLWSVDLGVERKLTALPPDLVARDFDVSPDGREVILERVQDHSDIVLIELARGR